MNQQIKAYQEIWKFEDVVEFEEKNLSVLLFDVDNHMYQLLTKNNYSVILVRPGNEYKQLSNHEIIIRPEVESDYEAVFRVCGKNIGSLLHYWSRNSYHKENIKEQLKIGFYSMAICIKKLIALKITKLSISYMYDILDGRSQPQYEAVSAFLRTIVREVHGLNCHCIGRDTNLSLEKFFPYFLNESKSNDIKYSQSGRLVKRFQEVLFGMKSSQTWLKSGGTYIITGGAGGIGLILAEYLLRKAKINLILIGRSPLTAKIQDSLTMLKKNGETVRYMQVDVTNTKDVEKLFLDCKKEYSSIDGVFHTAGITRDRYFVNKNLEEIQEVLLPKVYGCLNIYQALEKISPDYDFLVCFSSLAGSLGNIGQADYAFANHFMDLMAESFASYSSKIYSINWPYWENGGIHLAEEASQLMKKSYGLEPLNSSDAMEILDYALSNKLNRIMIFNPKNNMYKKLFINSFGNDEEEVFNNNYCLTYRDMVTNNGGRQLSQVQLEGEKSMIRKKLIEDIVSIVARILKLKESDVEIDESLSDYGFDSITFTELSSSIHSNFAIDIMPSIFFEYTTIEKVAEYLLDEHGNQLGDFYEKTNAITKTEDREGYGEGEGKVIHKVYKECENDLINIIADILKLKISDIDSSERLTDYGFESITFTELSNCINQKFNIHTVPSLFFEYNSIDELLTYLFDEYKEQIENQYREVSIAGSSKKQIVESYVEEKNDNKEYSKEDNKEIDNKEKTFTTKDSIAIVGMSGIFPGSNNLDEFWTNLVENKDLITEIPSQRWDWKEWYGQADAENDKTEVKWGGFIDQIDTFDAPFFGISPREAELMDPQQRLFLQCAYKTIEDAGYAVEDLSGSNTGIFVGVGNFDYLDLYKNSQLPIQAQSATGIAMSMVPSRVSYLLNLHGPSEQVDTACSSSLVAIHRAIQAIWNEDCEMAIVGGVNVIASPLMYVAYDKVGMLSKDGKCRSFDNEANGYVRGEGCGAILLKPLSKAEADNDHIYAVIKGSAVNHGGHSNTLTSPNPNAQAELISKAWERAGFPITTASYIEAHGTGTKLGDPIEINGLKKAFSKQQDFAGGEKSCGVATVKANIGHLETAAGIAGIIKTVLAMKYGMIPGNPQLNEINNYIDLEDSNLYLVKETKEWNRLKYFDGTQIPRRAGISSFGFGGVNAHIVLEEYEHKGENKTLETKDTYIIPLSSDSMEQVKEYAKELLIYLTNRTNYKAGSININSVCKDTAMVEQLKEIVADIAHIEKQQVPINETLFGLGFDTVQITQFQNEAKKLDGYGHIRQIEPNTDTLLGIAERMKQETKQSKTAMRNPFQEDDEITLRNIEYTLCQGRSNKKERVVFLVSDIEELITKLKAYVEDTKVDGIYSGTSCEDKLFSNVSSVAKNLLREELMKEKQFEQLAQLYVKGYFIDFRHIENNHSAKRISLPTYPFRRNKYWFDSFYKENQKPIQSSSTGTIKTKKSTGVTANSYDELNQKMKQAYSNYKGNEVSLEIVDNKIAVIRMQDRSNSNMLTENLLLGLMAKVYEVKNNDNIKVMVVTGYENVFCMGGTKEALLSIHERKSKCSDEPFIYRGLLDMDIPVITAIQGHATGAGLLFGLYGDIVVMNRNGVYSAVFMNYGFTPGMGSTYMLKEKMGANLAMEMMMTARNFSGEELERRGPGIIFKDNANLVLKEAMEIASNLAKKPKKSLTVLKREISSRILTNVTEAIEKEVQMHDETFSTEEVKEKINQIFQQSTCAKQEQTGSNVKSIQLKMPSNLDQNETISENQITLRAVEEQTIQNQNEVLDQKKTQNEQANSVYDEVVKIICNSLHIREDDLNEQLTFKEMGIDSVLGVEIVRDLNKKFDLKLETGVIYSYPTIDQLTLFINSNLTIEVESQKVDQTVLTVTSEENMDLTNILERFQEGEVDSENLERYLEDII